MLSVKRDLWREKAGEKAVISEHRYSIHPSPNIDGTMIKRTSQYGADKEDSVQFMASSRLNLCQVSLLKLLKLAATG